MIHHNILRTRTVTWTFVRYISSSILWNNCGAQKMIHREWENDNKCVASKEICRLSVGSNFEGCVSYKIDTTGVVLQTHLHVGDWACSYHLSVAWFWNILTIEEEKFLWRWNTCWIWTTETLNFLIPPSAESKYLFKNILIQQRFEYYNSIQF